MNRLAIFLGAMLASLLPLQPVHAQAALDLGPQPPGHFDFYVLALTWVPGFCATHRDPTECSQDLGFRLHGLWPESVNGYPSDCAAEALPEAIRSAYVGLFPSAGMIGHEWSKHGTCTGLGPAGFFEKTQGALASVVVPAAYQRRAAIGPGDAQAVKAAFLAANPGLMARSVVLACARGTISEVHVCLGKDGGPRMCAAWEAAEGNCR